jgi:hypothetical protein
MERRSSERIPTNLYVRFFYNKTVHTGIVTNLSSNGMCIETRMHIPLESRLEIYMLVKEAHLKISVKVSWQIRKNDRCCGMGIQLNQQQQHYKSLVESVRSTFFILRYPLSDISLLCK